MISGGAPGRWSLGDSVQVLKTTLFGIPLLKGTGELDHLSAQAMEEYAERGVRERGSDA
jgi:hypothetical protein